MKIKVTKKQRLGIILGAPFILLSMLIIFYFQGKNFIKSTIAKQIVRYQEQGYDLSYDNLEFSVSPFASAIIKNPSIRSPEFQGDWEWYGEKIIISPSLFSSNKINLSFIGKQNVRVENEYYKIDGEEISAKIKKRDFFPFKTFGVTIKKVNINSKNYIDKLSFNIRKLKQKQNDFYSPCFLINISGKNISTNIKNINYLPKKISSITLDTTVTGTVNYANFFSSFDTWTEEGGALEIHRFNINWGKLISKIKGTVAFDNNFMPMASFTMSSKGFFNFLDQLAYDKIVSSSVVSMAKIVLSKKVKKNNTLIAPISIFNNGIYIEKIKLGEF